MEDNMQNDDEIASVRGSLLKEYPKMGKNTSSVWTMYFSRRWCIIDYVMRIDDTFPPFDFTARTLYTGS